MRLLIISQYYLPGIGGTSNYVNQLIKYLDKYKVNYEMIAGELRNIDDFDRKQKYKIIRIPMIRKIRRTTALTFILNARLRLKKSFFDKFDLIHAHNPPSALIVPKTKTPLILTMHTYYSESFRFFSKLPLITKFSKFLEKKAIQKADVITCVSKDMVNKLKKEHPGKKIVYIPNFVDTDIFKPLKKVKKKKNTLLFAGMLYPLKNVDLLIKAVGKLRRKTEDIKLLIAGAGIQKNELIELTRELRLQKNVKFLGRKTQKEMIKLYNQASLLVLPSKSEAFGTVLLEAMSCGTKVLSSDVGGFIFATPDKRFLIKKLDDAHLANQIFEMLKMPYSSKKLRDYVVKNFSIEAVVRKHIKLYEEMIK